MKIRDSVNEFGTPVSVHVCEFCGDQFTVCPARITDKEINSYRGCLAPGCESYDPQRDVHLLMETGQIGALESDDPPEKEVKIQ